MSQKYFSLITFYLAAITAATTLAVDMSLPALPGMENLFKTNTAGMQYTMSIFMMGYAVGQFICGPLSDHYGRKPVLISGLIIYTLTSLFCAQSETLTVLILARGLQGAAAGTGPVLARAIVRDRFDPKNGAEVLSQITQIKMLVPLIAPLIGGYLLLWAGWQSIFYVLAGIGLILTIITITNISESRPPHQEDHSPGLSTIFRSFYLVLFHPKSFYPIAMVCTIYGGMITYMNNAPFLFQKVYGVSEQHFGYYYGTSGLALMIAAGVNKKMLRRHSQKTLYRRGIIISVISSIVLTVLALIPIHSIWTVLIPFAGYMVGLGFLVPNGIAIAMAPHPRVAGVASSLIGGLQISMGAVAVAVSGHFYNNTSLAMALTILGCTAFGGVLCFVFSLFKKIKD